jgi:hypothetical protein
MTVVYWGIPQYLQRNAGVVPRKGHDSFLLSFAVHWKDGTTLNPHHAMPNTYDCAKMHTLLYVRIHFTSHYTTTQSPYFQPNFSYHVTQMGGGCFFRIQTFSFKGFYITLCGMGRHKYRQYQHTLAHDIVCSSVVQHCGGVSGMNQLFIKRLVCDKNKKGYVLYQGILLVHQVPTMYNQQALIETYLPTAHIQSYIPCI